MIAPSEIQRKDRLGVTVKPEQLLNMAMKILCLQVSASLTGAFKFISNDIELTKAQIIKQMEAALGGALTGGPQFLVNVYGPPGCGKRIMLLATAEKIGARVIELVGDDLIDGAYAYKIAEELDILVERLVSILVRSQFSKNKDS